MTDHNDPVLERNTLYVTEDRLVCGRPQCAGNRAVYTGSSLGGTPLLRVTAEMAREMIAQGRSVGLTAHEVGACQCGMVNATGLIGESIPCRVCGAESDEPCKPTCTARESGA